MGLNKSHSAAKIPLSGSEILFVEKNLPRLRKIANWPLILVT